MMITEKKHNKKRLNEMAAFLSGEDVSTEKHRTDTGDKNRILARYWNAMGSGHDSRKIDIEKAWEKVRPAEENRLVIKPVLRYSFLIRAAAAVLVLSALGISGIYLQQSLKKSTVTISTSGDEINREVILPDGSHAWLNRNTTLSYNRTFRGSTRDLTITGEAFFEVVPDKEKPFIVNAGEATVRVTGTSFNVACSDRTERVEVYVESGTVILSGPSGENIILEPGYIGTVTGDELRKSVNENRNYMAWRTGLLVYEDAALRDVLPDLEKTFGIEVTVEDRAILDYRITTTFDHDPAETIVNVICITFNMRYAKDGNNYRLIPK